MLSGRGREQSSTRIDERDEHSAQGHRPHGALPCMPIPPEVCDLVQRKRGGGGPRRLDGRFNV